MYSVIYCRYRVRFFLTIDISSIENIDNSGMVTVRPSDKKFYLQSSKINVLLSLDHILWTMEYGYRQGGFHGRCTTEICMLNLCEMRMILSY